MISRDMKKRLARDTMVLGGIPFYFIVVVRAVIGQFPHFIFQLLISLLIIITLARFIKGSDQYIARALAVVVFTSLFYGELFFTIFAASLWIMMIFSLLYLKVKTVSVSKGIFIGIIASVAGHFITAILPL